MFGSSCVEGCHCEGEHREEFPSLCPPGEDPGFPAAAMWGHGESHKGTLAKTDALVAEEAAKIPACSETTVWGHGKGHKGSSVDTRADVELKIPARSEIAMWGHDTGHNGSLAEKYKDLKVGSQAYSTI